MVEILDEMKMGPHKSKEEQLRLGERVVDLRDIEKLKWRVIAERLGVNDITKTIYYYRKYKAVLKAAKERMNLEQVEQFSIKHGIDHGWVWLYENGFKRRVPLDVQEKIENAKMRSY